MEIHSQEIDKLMEALSLAQAEIGRVPKDAVNTYQNWRYATLASVLETIKPIYSHGLAITQLMAQDEDGAFLVTILGHVSGQWARSRVALSYEVTKGINELQALGKSLTYVKRYQIMAILNLADDDDQAGEPVHLPAQNQRQQQVQPPHVAPPAVPPKQPKKIPPAGPRPGNPSVLDFTTEMDKLGLGKEEKITKLAGSILGKTLSELKPEEKWNIYQFGRRWAFLNKNGSNLGNADKVPELKLFNGDNLEAAKVILIEKTRSATKDGVIMEDIDLD